jgi:hypothetical protein
LTAELVRRRTHAGDLGQFCRLARTEVDRAEDASVLRTPLPFGAHDCGRGVENRQRSDHADPLTLGHQRPGGGGGDGIQRRRSTEVGSDEHVPVEVEPLDGAEARVADQRLDTGGRIDPVNRSAPRRRAEQLAVWRKRQRLKPAVGSHIADSLRATRVQVEFAETGRRGDVGHRAGLGDARQQRCEQHCTGRAGARHSAVQRLAGRRFYPPGRSGRVARS